ncbi:GNAT family N-acetyltransferase [Ktedonobacteria bacterium brp13]|nr:GNAT family N-acetyltransferase [Ktedonobacteria bacterium brp13]
MNIRTIRETDAEAFLHLRRQIASETSFMLHDADEIKTVSQEQIQRFFLAGRRHLLLVVEENTQLVGYLMGMRGHVRKNSHVLTLAVGILQSFTRQMLGTQLFITMEQWARQNAITRLELQVHTNNTHAIALYSKQGFCVEGTMRHAHMINSKYCDEYMMAKILE